METTVSQSAQMVQWLIQKTHLEALFKNRESRERWEKYKKEQEDLIPRLKELRESLTVDIMVPIGNKAFMKGSLIHTNEVTISLGEGWFLKTTVDRAVEVCERRIKTCDEFLEKLDKEKKLLESRKDFSQGHGVFPEEEIREIVEPLDEDKEKEWEKSHRESLKNYAKQKAEEREEVKETNEDMWRRLEELELQEELRGEMEKLGIDHDLEEDDDEDDEDEDSELDSDDLSDVPEEEEENLKESLNQRVKKSESPPIKDQISVRSFVNDVSSPQPTTETQDPNKKVSKFKAARLAKK